MTLEEFLETIGLHPDECTNNPILQFNLEIEHNEHFAIDYQHGITAMNCIDIDNNKETITFKFRYKGN